jgi:hypothetical protein
LHASSNEWLEYKVMYYKSALPYRMSVLGL